LSQALTGYAIGLNLTWPQVTIPDFGAELKHVRSQIGADWISICPLVHESERAEWEAYAIANQGWIATSLELEGEDVEEIPQIPPFVFPLSEDPDATYAPGWQVTPINTLRSFIQYDSLHLVRSLYTSLKVIPRPTFGEFFYAPPDTNRSHALGGLTQTQEGPKTFLTLPIFDRAESDSKTLVGMVNSFAPWHAFFENILPSSTPPGLVLVLRHTCGEVQTIAYRLEGPDVTFLGAEYVPDLRYEALEDAQNFTSFPTIAGCTISTHVYGSAEFLAAYYTNQPIVFLVGIIVIFILAAIVFLVYDYAVEVRQKQVMQKVAKSNAIVNSLFPSHVRDRLMAGKSTEKDTDLFSGTSLATKNFRNGKQGEGGLHGEGTTISKPIADLYPHATVMFADIANFTAWSSVREPTQVFTLLEAIYSSFDKLAKKRRIFKVETIGDCYVAAVGLPEPRKDHAVVMSRFARDCAVEMEEDVIKLEVFLGPDTADLKIRIGLHSGPVTAGVLRGEKSRFQLFGDTVNTAARMQSTGEKSKIQISKDTADLLTEAGKGHWIKPRAELVAAKGKGNMQTYWLLLQQKDVSKHSFDFNLRLSDGGESLDDFEINDLKDDRKHDRLVDWNVEILMGLLQKIVAMRTSPPSSKDLTLQPSYRDLSDLDRTDHSHMAQSKTLLDFEDGATVLDELQEIITLANKSSKLKCDPATISLGPEVESELRDFVKTISYMYQNNPFHNFEHASHVTQSITKLISRVVTADEIDYEDMTYKKKGAPRELHDYSYGITSDPLIEFSCTLSALIHDVDHPGIPNARLIQEGADMAVHYKNKSMAEQNSVELAWELLMEPQYRELRKVIYTSQSELNRFRQLIVNSVMATDIVDKELGAQRKKRWEKAFSLNEDADALQPPEAPLDSVNRKATIVIEHLIQAADVAHTMQHWHVFLKWNERLFREMYEAYLNGRSDVDPSVGWFKSEIGFFNFYIIPLAKKLENCGVFGVSSDECLGYAEANLVEWEQKGESIVQGYLGHYQQERAPA
jgi:class 3 adenylate cyclase